MSTLRSPLRSGGSRSLLLPEAEHFSLSLVAGPGGDYDGLGPTWWSCLTCR